MKKLIFFLTILWRKWDEGECNFGCKHVYRIGAKTAWEVANIIFEGNRNEH